jgi:regulator of replication initiation timing
MYISLWSLLIGISVIGGIIIFLLMENQSLDLENIKLKDDLEVAEATCEGYKTSVNRHIEELDEFTNA